MQVIGGNQHKKMRINLVRQKFGVSKGMRDVGWQFIAVVLF